MPSRRPLSSTRRSASALIKLTPNIATVTLATAMASRPGDRESSVIVRVGSGTTSTARKDGERQQEGRSPYRAYALPKHRNHERRHAQDHASARGRLLGAA